MVLLVSQEYLDGAAEYCLVPLTLTLDVLSDDRSDGLQYRMGLHHVRHSQLQHA